MLEPWALNNAKIKKKIVAFLYEGKCSVATFFHADTSLSSPFLDVACPNKVKLFYHLISQTILVYLPSLSAEGDKALLR